jgi:deoxyribodipyrimidine photo-lyase
VPLFTGGTTAATKMLRRFIADSLPTYAAHRGQPQTNDVSHMSKFLHYGQISPVYIALSSARPAAGRTPRRTWRS